MIGKYMIEILPHFHLAGVSLEAPNANPQLVGGAPLADIWGYLPRRVSSQ
jgi:hypothetical protein